MTQTALATIQEVDTTAMQRADLVDSTKAKYTREIQILSEAGVNPFDRNALIEYAAGLKSSRRAFLKSALRLMTADYEQQIKVGATPENLPKIQAAVIRLEAMRRTVKVKQHWFCRPFPGNEKRVRRKFISGWCVSNCPQIW